MGFPNQEHLLQRSASMICSRPFQLWPCEHRLQTLWHNTLPCIAAVSFLVLNDPTAPDLRERKVWSECHSGLSQWLALRTLRTMLMKLLAGGTLHFYIKFLTLSLRRKSLSLRGKKQHFRYLRCTETRCFAWHLLPLRGFSLFEQPHLVFQPEKCSECFSQLLWSKGICHDWAFSGTEDDLPPFLRPWGVLSLAGSQSTMAGN